TRTRREAAPNAVEVAFGHLHHSLPNGAYPGLGERWLALQAPEARVGEVLVAELRLGQVVVAVDHLVVERSVRASDRRVESVSAFVAVLITDPVVPAGRDIGIGYRLHDL